MTQDADRPAAVAGRTLITGERLASVTGRTFVSGNPDSRSDLVDAFQVSSAADVAMAVRAAEVAFPAWRDARPEAGLISPHRRRRAPSCRRRPPGRPR